MKRVTNDTQQIADDWHEWKGSDDGNGPVPDWDIIEYRLRNGTEHQTVAASVFWHHTGDWDDVVAYRALKAPHHG